MVGREARRITRMPVRMLRLALRALTLTTRAITALTRTAAGAIALTIAAACIPTRASARTATTRLAAVRLLGATTIGIAMAAWASIDAIGYVPRTHRGRVVATLLAGAHALAGLAFLALHLEALVGLVGCCFAADGQTAGLARGATATAIFADMVKTTQFATFIGGVGGRHDSC